MQMDGLKVLIFLPDSFRSRNLSMVRTESGPCSQSALSILAPGPIRRQYYLDRVLGQSVVGQHPLDLLLQLPRRRGVQVVGEPSANQSSVFSILTPVSQSGVSITCPPVA